MWDSGDAYERFMGRWSRAVARQFVDRVPVVDGATWLDVGCGTGALLDVVLQTASPRRVVGIDPSPAFVTAAARGPRDPGVAAYALATAERLPCRNASFDATVSGLALNRVPDPGRAVAEMVRVTRPGGCVAAYVWDYDHADFFLTRVWAALAEIRGRREPGDEGGRWSLCSRDGLDALTRDAGLEAQVFAVTTPTRFDGVADLWDGLLLGVGPAGAAVTALPESERRALRAVLARDLPRSADGSVALSARAWAFTALVQ